jgi:hypothetical protein
VCNLYSMTRAREAMLRLFRVSDNRAAAIEAKPAIFPGYVGHSPRKTRRPKSTMRSAALHPHRRAEQGLRFQQLCTPVGTSRGRGNYVPRNARVSHTPRRTPCIELS